MTDLSVLKNLPRPQPRKKPQPVDGLGVRVEQNNRPVQKPPPVNDTAQGRASSYEAAIQLLPLGFSVIPTNPDKTPAIPSWKQYQSESMAAEVARKLFRNDCRIAVICGSVSGNLECLDFDKADLFQPFLDTLGGIDQTLRDKLVQIQTPSGGYHLIYRCESKIDGNQKLAQSKNNKIWIETRGEGGYFLTAPSPGYTILRHSLEDTPTITAKERDLLLNLALSYTEKPDLAKQARVTSNITGLRPGDDFNQRHVDDIPKMLKSFGWTCPGRTGPGGQHWTRPGKNSGTSATLKDGCFYVFTTNASIPPGPHNAFSVYTYQRHGGDFSAAAKDLVTQNYGGTGPKRDDTANQGQPKEWEDPISIETPMLPPVTREMMPAVLGDMVFAISANTETPPELALMLGLPVCATACQKKYVVQCSPGHIEQLSLWGVAALESGNRKSSVEKKMISPLRNWEVDAREELAPLIKEAAAQRENELAIIKGLRGSLQKSKPPERDKIMAEILQLEQKLTEVPKPPQVWEQDITPEHLGTVMNDNHECMGLFSSEGGIFDIISGRYSKGVPNLDIFLQAHSGDPVRVSRGSRSPVNLSEPALSIGISPQPSVIKEMSDRPGFRGRGLIARFTYALPISPLGTRSLTNRPVISDEVYVRYSAAIQKLLAERYPEDTPVAIPLSPAANKMWTAFALEVENDLRDGGRFEDLKDWAGKLPGLIARIAGVYHCIDPDGNSVSGRTMAMALRLAEVLITHALAVFDLMGADEEMSGARKILNWIRKNNLSEFPRRDCFEATKGTFKRVPVMKPSLSILEEHLIIRKLPSSEKKKGRPTVLFEVNPKLNCQPQEPLRNIRKNHNENARLTDEDPFCEYCEPVSGSEKIESSASDTPQSTATLTGGDDDWEEI